MKKIAILRCLRSNDVCTGAACMHAINNKLAAFSQYGDEEIELVAFFSCNGCGDCLLTNQNGLQSKLETIIKLQPDAVHVGVCTMHRNEAGDSCRCFNIVEICKILEMAGIKVVDGTH